MVWHSQRAKERIRNSMTEVPQVIAENYSETYLPRYLAEQEQLLKSGGLRYRPLTSLPQDRAVVADTVQIYVNLINYNDYLFEKSLETPASHARALKFLHLHYGACDRVIGGAQAQRVDFHGPRVHAVILDNSGYATPKERLIAAIDLAHRLTLLSQLANTEIANGGYKAEYRVGIDFGRCVAINSGQGDEQEPLFLGSAANYAAKLAEGDQPGIYLSHRARQALGMPVPGPTSLPVVLSDIEVKAMVGASSAGTEAERLLKEWKDDLREQRISTGGQSRFEFHQHTPPLNTIDYSLLSPGNSIRMPVASLFADLDKYTAYIDEATARGHVGSAVRALHVIRKEMQSAFEEDFGGRKVRFIGDCMHGLIAEGSAQQINAADSVRAAVTAAGGLRSSFHACQEALPDINNLGLAIGIEYGPTPISRIGIRGERSVRVASSIATAQSEAVQQVCNGRQTGLGPTAYGVAPLTIQKLFGPHGVAPLTIQKLFGPHGVATDLGYEDAALMLAVAAPAIIKGGHEFRAHAQ